MKTSKPLLKSIFSTTGGYFPNVFFPNFKSPSLQALYCSNSSISYIYIYGISFDEAKYRYCKKAKQQVRDHSNRCFFFFFCCCCFFYTSLFFFFSLVRDITGNVGHFYKLRQVFTTIRFYMIGIVSFDASVILDKKMGSKQDEC